MIRLVTKLKAMLLAATLVAGAAPAFAAEHIINVYSKAYFPTTLYVAVGDTVKFKNMTNNHIRIPINGFGNVTGYIQPGETGSILFGMGIDRVLGYPTIGSTTSISTTPRGWVRYGTAPRE